MIILKKNPDPRDSFCFTMVLHKNKVLDFLIKALLLYVAWFLLYELWLHPQQTVDLIVINLTVFMSREILELFGYSVFFGADRLIGIDGTSGLWIGDNCNGIVIFALFAGFIIAYPGKAIRKLIFIMSGIILLQIINVLRVVGLAIMQTHSMSLLEFNHTYTFTIIIYGVTFMLWMLWVNKYSLHSNKIIAS